jgi:hypothetical protein
MKEDPLKAQQSEDLLDTQQIAEKEAYRGSLLTSVRDVDRATKQSMDKQLGEVNILDLTQEEVNALAYKTMNPYIYYTVNVAIYVLEAYLGIILGDIGAVFGFIGTFAGCGLGFFLPSWFFYNGYMRFASKKYKAENRVNLIVAIANFVIGIFAFGLFLYSNVAAIIEG